MPQVARARISGSIVVVPEVTTGDHPKDTNCRQRTGFGPAQGVLAIAVSNDRPLEAARQVNVPYERITWIHGTLALVAVAFGPTCVIAAIACVLV